MVESCVLEMAMEMLQPVQEISTGKGIKAFLSSECKAGKECLKDARRLRRDGNESAAQKKFDDAINHYENVRKECYRIEDEGIFDWIVSLCIKPWPILLTQIINAGGDLNGMTRSSSVKIINDCISNIKTEKKNG